MNLFKRQEIEMNKDEQESAGDWELIHSYSREQALKDGVLVGTGELAKEAGFTMPLALTAAVYAAYVKVPDEVSGQDKTGRLWDILNMLRFAIKKQSSYGPICEFQVYVSNNDDYPADLITLKAHCGPPHPSSPSWRAHFTLNALQSTPCSPLSSLFFPAPPPKLPLWNSYPPKYS